MLTQYLPIRVRYGLVYIGLGLFKHQEIYIDDDASKSTRELG